MVSNNFVLFDSSIWAAYLNPLDSQHAKAEKVFNDAEQQSSVIILPEYIILEVCTVLMIRTGKEAADAFLQNIRDNRMISILHSTPAILEGVMARFVERADRHLSFVDVSLLLFSESYAVITFDKKLATEIQSKFPANLESR